MLLFLALRRAVLPLLFSFLGLVSPAAGVACVTASATTKTTTAAAAQAVRTSDGAECQS